MKLLASLVVCSLLLPPSGDRLSLAEEADRTYRRSFDVESTLELADTRFFIDGEEETEDEFDVTYVEVFRKHLVVVDTVEEVAEGSASSFEREYVELSGYDAFEWSMLDESLDEKSNSTSKLEGVKVRFVTDGEAFEPSFAEETRFEDALIAGLEAVLSLGSILPPEEVEIGHTWLIDIDFFRGLVSFGGDLHLEPEDGEPLLEEFEMEDLDLDGNIEGCYVDRREEQGRVLALIELKLDVGSYVDMSEHALEFLGLEGENWEDVDPPGDLSWEMDETYVGTGMALWDIESGCLQSLTLELEVTRTETTVETTVTFEDGEEYEEEMEEIMTYEGTVKYEVRCND